MPVAADKMETTDLVHAMKAAHTDVTELEDDIKGKEGAERKAIGKQLNTAKSWYKKYAAELATRKKHKKHKAGRRSRRRTSRR